MGLGTSRNRRRADARERRDKLRGAAVRHAPWLARALVALALVCGLGFGAWRGWAFCTTSPRFAVTRLSFSGLERASEAELLKLAGLCAGQNLFALDAPAAERAMASHPWVKSVRISRRFPDGLSVEVQERAPHALVVLESLYLLDAEGQPFRKAQPGDALDLPLVTGVDRDAYARDPAAATSRIAAALEVAGRYSQAPESRRARLSEVRLEPDGGLTLVTSPGQEVRLGEGDYQAKLARLWRVRDELQARSMAADLIHLENRVRPAAVAVRISGQVSERSPAR